MANESSFKGLLSPEWVSFMEKVGNCNRPLAVSQSNCHDDNRKAHYEGFKRRESKCLWEHCTSGLFSFWVIFG
ncbi:hypothetical protein B9S53_19705 [Arthrospira sp. O9.13F]|nr:hypothetical protein B9S53_19705 [Arthrospira sp. O9.13F]